MNVYEELKQHLKNLSTKPSEEYLRKTNLSDKYRKLGFRDKFLMLEKEVKEIQPAPHGDFLWISLNLKHIYVEHHGNDGFFVVILERVLLEENVEGFIEKIRALILVPSEQWIGDVPEEVLDQTLLVKHNFKSLYVVAVVSGYRKKDSWVVIPDLENIVRTRARATDPMLLGSFSREIERSGPANFAVLGVWGTDWHELDFSS